MMVTVLAALSALMIVAGLIYFLTQLINGWSDPERHWAGENGPRTAEGQQDVQV